MTVVGFRESTRTQLHERLLDAAQTITVHSGWASVTMAKIGFEVGVSRQTVYNEFGNKPLGDGSTGAMSIICAAP